MLSNEQMKRCCNLWSLLIKLLLHVWLSGRKQQTHNLFSFWSVAGSNPVACILSHKKIGDCLTV